MTKTIEWQKNSRWLYNVWEAPFGSFLGFQKYMFLLLGCIINMLFSVQELQYYAYFTRETIHIKKVVFSEPATIFHKNVLFYYPPERVLWMSNLYAKKCTLTITNTTSKQKEKACTVTQICYFCPFIQFYFIFLLLWLHLYTHKHIIHILHTYFCDHFVFSSSATIVRLTLLFIQDHK